MNDALKTLLDHVGQRAEKHYKTTLFSEPNLMVGLNCLEPRQAQHVHTHADQTKFYYVVAGEGWFTVGEETFSASAGQLIWAAQGVPHGVENRGDETLTLLVGIAPAP